MLKFKVLLNGLRKQLAYEHLLSLASQVWSLTQYNKLLGFKKRGYASFYIKKTLLERKKKKKSSIFNIDMRNYVNNHQFELYMS
jgi:hypothetical protein